MTLSELLRIHTPISTLVEQSVATLECAGGLQDIAIYRLYQTSIAAAMSGAITKGPQQCGLRRSDRRELSDLDEP